MKISILFLLSFLTLSANAEILKVEGPSYRLSREVCRGLASVHLTENTQEQIAIKVNLSYTQSGGPAGHPKTASYFTNLKEGSLEVDQDQVFYVNNGMKYLLAVRNNSIFSNYGWDINNNIHFDLVRSSIAGSSGCAAKVILTIDSH